MNKGGYATNFIGVRVRQGEAHHNARFTADKVRELRRLHEQRGLCVKCISLLHEVPYATCWEMLSYRTWKHVKGVDE